jgi:hypothetical protein
MSRVALLSLTALTVIFCAVFISGCSTLPPDINNMASNDTAPASGHVHLDNKAVAGARIEAISLNGSSVITTRTNARGAYTLNLLHGVSYNVTASFEGLKHTITPVRLNPPGIYNSDMAGQYDINLSKKPSSTLSGFVSPKGVSGKGSGALVIAILP